MSEFVNSDTNLLTMTNNSVTRHLSTGLTGLEPATSAVTGRYSLLYIPFAVKLLFTSLFSVYLFSAIFE
jgi:hypothetical protein